MPMETWWLLRQSRQVIGNGSGLGGRQHGCATNHSVVLWSCHINKLGRPPIHIDLDIKIDPTKTLRRNVVHIEHGHSLYVAIRKLNAQTKSGGPECKRMHRSRRVRKTIRDDGQRTDAGDVQDRQNPKQRRHCASSAYKRPTVPQYKCTREIKGNLPVSNPIGAENTPLSHSSMNHMYMPSTEPGISNLNSDTVKEPDHHIYPKSV